MTLLKGDGTIKQSKYNLNIRDGWNFGIGFGLAMAIAVPVILLLLGCIIGVAIVALGGSLGALL